MVERKIHFVAKDQLPRNLSEMAMCLGFSGEEAETYIRAFKEGRAVLFTIDRDTNVSKITGIIDFSLDLDDLFKKDSP